MSIENKIFELHLNITDNNISTIDLLTRHTQFSRQKIKQIMQNGSVWLTQQNTTRRIRRAKKQLNPGQILHCYYNEEIFSQKPSDAVLIADEQDYSVWFKPAGMLSQGSKYGDHCTLYRWAETHINPQRNAFIVHRLDKATSGLMLIAHSKKAAAGLSALFAEGAVNKFYKAIVHGIFPDKDTLPVILDEPLNHKQARTKVLHSQNFICSNRPASLLDIRLLTGRKHQIRQHLSYLNHPIIGDRLYGRGKTDGQDLCLMAYKISFLSPFDKQSKRYELDLSYYPEIFKN